MNAYGNFAATVDRAALLHASKLLGKVIEKRNTIPILSCLLLEATDNGVLVLRGTDLDIFATVRITASACQPGKALVTFDALAKALAKAKGATVSLADVGAALRMTTENGASARLARPEKSEASDMPVPLAGMVKLSHSADFDGAQLRDDLARVRMAVSTEETRYYLNGICAHVLPEAGQLALAATDGHRLAVQRRPAPASFLPVENDGERKPGIPDTIMPRKMVDCMLAAMAKVKGDAARVRLSIGASGMRFENSAIVLESKVIDGTFPDYARIIPSARNSHRVLSVDAPALVEAAKAVTAHVSGKTKPTALMMDDGGQWLTASASDSDGNRCAMVIEGAAVRAEAGKDGEFVIGANGKYLVELAGHFPGVVDVTMQDSACPILFTSRDLPDFEAVLMPLRMDGAGISPAGIAALNRSALDVFDADAPGMVNAVDSAKAARIPALYSKRQLAALIRAAIAFVCSGNADRRAARLMVLARLARIRGAVDQAARLEFMLAHQPASTFLAWSRGVQQLEPVAAVEAVEPVAVVEETVPIIQPDREAWAMADHVADAGEMVPVTVDQPEAVSAGAPDVAALMAIIGDLSARLERLEGAQEGRGEKDARSDVAGASSRSSRTGAHEAAVRKAWAERRGRRELAKRLADATNTIESVVAQRDDLKRIAAAHEERADEAEGMVRRLVTRIERMGIVLAGRKRMLGEAARQLLFARNRGAELQRELDEARALVPDVAATRSGLRVVGAGYSFGRKAHHG